MAATYPNVPNAPGVPSVFRVPGAAISTAALLVADAISIANLFQGPQWGIFNAAMSPVVLGDSVVRVSYGKEFRVSDYPIEGGGFASYDKVATPYDARVTFTCGGSFTLQSALSGTAALAAGGSNLLGILTGAAARAAFLAALDAATASVNLYTLVTPDVSYQNANIIHYDYERTDRNGATMLTVDVWLQEIRVAPAPQFSKTQAPSGADPTNDGTVQTVPVTSAPLAAPASPSGLSTFQFE